MSLLPSLRLRAEDPELLDQGVPEAEALRSLLDLRFVNRWLGNPHRVLRAAGPHLPAAGRILDVGSASGDLPAYLASRLPGPLQIVGLDRRALHFRYAPPLVRRVVADVRALPFAPRSFDLVTASLFLHHFGDRELPGLLASLFSLTRGALIVSDLHRSPVSYLFGRIFFPLLFRSPVSVADGLVSIRRGFTARELRSLFEAAGLPGVTVSRSFPYRLLAVAERTSEPGLPPRPAGAPPPP